MLAIHSSFLFRNAENSVRLEMWTSGGEGRGLASTDPGTPGSRYNATVTAMSLQETGTMLQPRGPGTPGIRYNATATGPGPPENRNNGAATGLSTPGNRNTSSLIVELNKYKKSINS